MTVFRADNVRFYLDVSTGKLRRDHEEVRLAKQEWDLLLYLAENPQVLISHDRLIEKVWGGKHVNDAAVARSIHKLRRALGDDPSAPAIIETIPKRGVRFIAQLEPFNLGTELSTISSENLQQHTSRVADDKGNETELVFSGTRQSDLIRPEYLYQRLFTVASLTIPYIVLVNSFDNGIHEYRLGDVDVNLRADKWSKLPHDFNVMPIRDFNENETKCRLETLHWRTTKFGRPFPLVLEFTEISYGDYLKSGEYLDSPVPSQPDKTFRDLYGPDFLSTHDFSSSRLTNICGVGVFLVTRDGQIILSRHSDNVHVLGQVVSYSASGTMDWNLEVDPIGWTEKQRS